MQAIGERSGVAEVMVVVEHRIGEALRHVSNLFGLCHEVQRAMLNILQDVGHTIGSMQIHVALLFAYEGLVAVAGELFPDAHEVLHNVDVRTCFDIKVTGIKVSAHVESWNELEGLVFGIGGLPLRM